MFYWGILQENLLKAKCRMDIPRHPGEKQLILKNEEIKFVIQFLKNNKAPAKDGISAVLLKQGGK